MKKLILLIAAVGLVLTAGAQSNAIDDMFDKYSEREGFTSVYISSKMFSMFAGQDNTNTDGSDIIRRLKSIRILSVDDSLMNRSINFYNELGRKLDYSVYEELMAVKKGADITKFLIRQNGNIISELLVITGGPGDNSIISIKGDLDLKSISDLSNNSGIDKLKSLKDIDKKGP